jgi:hypothetical protein
MGEYLGIFRAPEDLRLDELRARLTNARFEGWQKSLFPDKAEPTELYWGFAGKAFPETIPESEIALNEFSTDAWGLVDQPTIAGFDRWRRGLDGPDWERAKASLTVEFSWQTADETELAAKVGWACHEGILLVEMDLDVSVNSPSARAAESLMAANTWRELLELLQVEAVVTNEDDHFRVDSPERDRLPPQHHFRVVNPGILRFARTGSPLDDFKVLDEFRRQRSGEWQSTLGLVVSTLEPTDGSRLPAGLGNRLWREVAAAGLSKSDDLRVSGRGDIRTWDELARAISARRDGGITIELGELHRPDLEKPVTIHLRSDGENGNQIDVRTDSSVYPSEVQNIGTALGVTFPKEPTDVW